MTIYTIKNNERQYEYVITSKNGKPVTLEMGEYYSLEALLKILEPSNIRLLEELKVLKKIEVKN